MVSTFMQNSIFSGYKELFPQKISSRDEYSPPAVYNLFEGKETKVKRKA